MQGGSTVTVRRLGCVRDSKAADQMVTEVGSKTTSAGNSRRDTELIRACGCNSSSNIRVHVRIDTNGGITHMCYRVFYTSR